MAQKSWIIVIISTILILDFFFVYQQAMKGAEVKKSVSERILAESANLATISLSMEKKLWKNLT